MSNKNEKSSNGTEKRAENNIFRTITKTTEQLTASAARYDERAENGQKIVFIMAEQKKAVGNAANADKDGYLQGIFWTGYVTTQDGTRHDFERLDSNGISRHFADICTWRRATRATLLDGNATRTEEQRKVDSMEAYISTRNKASENSVMAVIFEKIESNEELRKDILSMIVDRMEKADTIAAEKAQSKESKTAKAQRELEEAKTAAAAAESANEKAIQMLLATGLYKDEAEVREKLGL